MKEEGLHQAILEAVNSLAQGRGKEMVSCLQDTLVSSTAGTFDVHAIQRQLDEKGQENGSSKAGNDKRKMMGSRGLKELFFCAILKRK